MKDRLEIVPVNEFKKQEQDLLRDIAHWCYTHSTELDKKEIAKNIFNALEYGKVDLQVRYLRSIRAVFAEYREAYPDRAKESRKLQERIKELIE